MGVQARQLKAILSYMYRGHCEVLEEDKDIFIATGKSLMIEQSIECIKWHKCGQCDYKTDISSHLKLHRQGQHVGVKISCDQCHYENSDKSNMKKHKKGEHLED